MDNVNKSVNNSFYGLISVDNNYYYPHVINPLFSQEKFLQKNEKDICKIALYQVQLRQEKKNVVN